MVREIYIEKGEPAVRPTPAGETAIDGTNADNYASALPKLDTFSKRTAERTVVLEWNEAQDGDLEATDSFSLRIAGTNETFEAPSGTQLIVVGYRTITTLTSATDAATVGLEVPVDLVDGILAPVAISDAGNPWDATTTMTNTLITAADLNPGSWQAALTAQRTVDIKNTHASEDVTAGHVLVYAKYLDYV